VGTTKIPVATLYSDSLDWKSASNEASREVIPKVWLMSKPLHITHWTYTEISKIDIAASQ
jgi:hypothetical protein